MKNIKRIIKDATLRVKAAFESHSIFFHIYFPHYIEFVTAEFQKEMFQHTQSFKNLVIVAFRGSGKSTIMNMSLPLWAIMGKLQCKYVLIVGLTQEQAKQHLKNIKHELETNERLKKDLGPFKEIENDWSAYTIEIPNFNARISAVSIDQSIRGTRHGAHRPDLIICDDIEDMNSVRTLESRDKVDDFITSELIPAGTAKTKMVVIGNLLHEDSLVMRLKKRIEDKEFEGIFRAYPLMDEDGECLWPGKFPTEEHIQRERKRIGKATSFQREYMLKIVTDYDRVVPREWIQTYSGPPPDKIEGLEYRYTITGIDLAISQSERADYTAMVSAKVFGYGDEMLIYILPNPVNDRLSFGETQDLAKALYEKDHKSLLVVEDVAYQKAALQQLQERGCRVKGFKPKGDKVSRLSLISHYIQRGQVLFPEKGAKKLIQQMVNLGLERHDDLNDACVMVVSYAANEKRARVAFYPIN